MFYMFMRLVAYIVLRPFYGVFVWGGLRFEGVGHIPKRGGVLIAPNHICYLDPPTVAMACRRHAYIMAWVDLFKIPVLGTLITWLRAFPVKPGTPDRHALKFAEEKLKGGEAVIIFPEGTVSPTGELLPLRAGVLMIAQRAGAPIVPCSVQNTNLVMPYEQVRPRITKKPITVRFGPPVTVDQLSGGVKGGEGYKIGAERLFLLMKALQEDKPYPELGPVTAADLEKRRAAEEADRERQSEDEAEEPAVTAPPA